MSNLPCSVGPHFSPFVKRNGYLHAWAPGISWDRRLRFCNLHGTIAQENLAEFKWDSTDLTAGAVSVPTKCVTCLQPVNETGLHLSLTYYPSKDEREDYWTRLHLDCELPFYLAQGEPRS